MKYTKIIWSIIGLLILLPVLTNMLGLINTPVTQGSIESWISFFGSYLGGIVGGVIGALIAYGVAKYQIDKQKQNSKIELFIKQLPVLIKIKMELEAFNSNFMNTQSIFIENNTPVPIEITAPMTLPEVDLVEIKELSSILDAELQADLIKVKYYHNDLVKILAFNTYQHENNFNKVFSEFEKLNTKKVRSKSEELKLRELIEEVKNLELKKQSSISNKNFYLGQLEEHITLNNNLITRIEKVYKKALELSKEYDLLQM